MSAAPSSPGTPGTAPARPAAPGWIVSPAYDLAWFSGPALLASLAALLVPDGAEVGLFGWLVLVVIVDVAHTWATLYRAWLDPAARRDRPALLWGVPLVVFAAAMTVHTLAAPWFWTVLAYVAVFHFVRQQQGFAALYRARAGIARATLEARVEHFTVAMLCVFPVAWWHAHLPRRYAWFTPTDFLVGLPPAVATALGVVTALSFATWLGLRTRTLLQGRRDPRLPGGPRPGGGPPLRSDPRLPSAPHLRTGAWQPGRDLWVLSTAVSWTVGIVLTDGDAAFTLANVLAHGVPYFALVHHVGRRQWADGEGAVTPRWFAPAAILAFLALPVAAAFAEELAWDALVWREHFFAPADLPEWLVAVAVPLLATPQLTHYLLDGYLWRLGPPGSGLRRWVLG
ncbi:MAG: hypothetical protein Q8P41_02245 [Pseudomonadota bacterium]|nr:hypothetical protein [Pseudomonadota bacterium]